MSFSNASTDKMQHRQLMECYFSCFDHILQNFILIISPQIIVINPDLFCEVDRKFHNLEWDDVMLFK